MPPADVSEVFSLIVQLDRIGEEFFPQYMPPADPESLFAVFSLKTQLDIIGEEECQQNNPAPWPNVVLPVIVQLVIVGFE